MKLELKHLAGYLPYGLKAYDSRSTIELCASYLLVDDEFKNEFISICEITNGGKFWIKPILRPLSDLTKEIEVNGEKFVPSKILENQYLSTSFWGTNSIGSGILGVDGKMKNLCFIDNEIIGECPYMIYEKLLSWHFDIYGLIENGLAIDINTL